MKYFFLFLMVALLQGEAFSRPSQVMIIRHAEKPQHGTHLNLKGQERAACLAPFFIGTEKLNRSGVPVAIYARAATQETPSIRPIETVAPLAKSLGISILSGYGGKDLVPMTREILSNPDYDNKLVLICWDHHGIPAIARLLGANQAPEKWYKSVFDRVWILTFKGHEVEFEDMPERLLFGDSEE